MESLHEHEHEQSQYFVFFPRTLRWVVTVIITASFQNEWLQYIQHSIRTQ